MKRTTFGSPSNSSFLTRSAPRSVGQPTRSKYSNAPSCTFQAKSQLLQFACQHDIECILISMRDRGPWPFRDFPITPDLSVKLDNSRIEIRRVFRQLRGPYRSLLPKMS
jgi:hypothetical protein